MRNILAETLEIIKEKNYKQKIIDSEEMIEQEDNLRDLKVLLDSIYSVLDQIQKKENENNENIRNLLKLHMQFCDLIWHYEQVHGVLNKLITSYDFD